MSNGALIALLIVLVVVCYVAAKVLYYMRRSDEQWSRVDKSKLKTWEDDD